MAKLLAKIFSAAFRLHAIAHKNRKRRNPTASCSGLGLLTRSAQYACERNSHIKCATQRIGKLTSYFLSCSVQCSATVAVQRCSRLVSMRMHTIMQWKFIHIITKERTKYFHAHKLPLSLIHRHTPTCAGQIFYHFIFICWRFAMIAIRAKHFQWEKTSTRAMYKSSLNAD